MGLWPIYLLFTVTRDASSSQFYLHHFWWITNSMRSIYSGQRTPKKTGSSDMQAWTYSCGRCLSLHMPYFWWNSQSYWLSDNGVKEVEGASHRRQPIELSVLYISQCLNFPELSEFRNYRNSKGWCLYLYHVYRICLITMILNFQIVFLQIMALTSL